MVEAEHDVEDTSRTPLKPLEAMLSIDLSHPNIIHTYKYYTRIRQVKPALCHCYCSHSQTGCSDVGTV